MTMTPAKIDAIIATAYNLFIGARDKVEPITPEQASKLGRADRAVLLKALRDRGGSDLYTQEEAGEALALIVNREA